MVTVLIFQQIKLFRFKIKRFVTNLLLVVKTLLVFLLIQFKVDAGRVTIFVAHGQHKTIQTLKLLRFSIGNKDVIQAKLEGTQGPIMIKANKLGQSELVLWLGRKSKVYYTVNIISKKQYQKLQL